MSEIETKRKREVADDNRPTFQVTKAPTLRRTGAFLCDLLTSFIFGIFFLSCVIVYVFDAIFDTTKVEQAFVAREKESGLLVDDPNGVSNGVWLNTLLTYEEGTTTAAQVFNHFDGPIKNFYISFAKAERIELKNYYIQILNAKCSSEGNPSLFTCSPSDVNEDNMATMIDTFTYTLSINATAKDVYNFYMDDTNGAFIKARYAMFYDDEVDSTSRQHFVFFISEIATSIVLSSLLTWYIIPLFFKQRQTFGQKLLNLAPLSRATGLRISQGQHLLRFTIMLVAEIIGGFLTVGIFPIISFSMMCFSKESTSFHDYASATIVCDTKLTKVFNTSEELLEWQKDQMEASSTYTEREGELSLNRYKDRVTYVANDDQESEKK